MTAPTIWPGAVGVAGAPIRADGARQEFETIPAAVNDLKDDDTLVDAIVEKLYGTMKDFDAGRAKQTVELIVDRDTTAASKFRAMLDDLWPRRPSNLAA
jgi:hypothetical protein